MRFIQDRLELVPESESESESTLKTDSGVGVDSDENPIDSAALAETATWARLKKERYFG